MNFHFLFNPEPFHHSVGFMISTISKWLLYYTKCIIITQLMPMVLEWTHTCDGHIVFTWSSESRIQFSSV